MGNYWSKQASSRPLKLQELDYTGSSTLQTTTFTSQTYQVRVFSDVRGYLSFGSTGISTSSRAGNGAVVEIAPSLRGEYFTVTPGQFVEFSSTSTSSGSVLITEMA